MDVPSASAGFVAPIKVLKSSTALSFFHAWQQLVPRDA